MTYWMNPAPGQWKGCRWQPCSTSGISSGRYGIAKKGHNTLVDYKGWNTFRIVADGKKVTVWFKDIRVKKLEQEARLRRGFPMVGSFFPTIGNGSGVQKRMVHAPNMERNGNMMKRIVAVGCCIALGLLAGCGKQGDSAKESGKKRVALIMKSLANEFFKTMEDGARAHWKAHADEYDLECNGIKDEQDVNRQIEIVNQMIAKRVDAIVIAPADSKALIPVCRKAMEKGVTVINIDNKFDSAVLKQEQVQISFVGPDNRKGAKLAGDYLAKSLKKGDKVAILEGRPGAFNGIQRKLGFEDAMKAAGMEICTSQSAYWEQKNAFDIATQIHAKFGAELKAVLCANDSMALGAVQALKGKEVKIIGFDNISAIQTLIKEGKVLCTVDQYAGKIAVNGIEYALEVLKTGNKPEDRETAVDLVTIGDLK